jgi:hypothetical protein
MEGGAFQTRGHYFWREFGKSNQKSYPKKYGFWKLDKEKSASWRLMVLD